MLWYILWGIYVQIATCCYLAPLLDICLLLFQVKHVCDYLDLEFICIPFLCAYLLRRKSHFHSYTRTLSFVKIQIDLSKLLRTLCHFVEYPILKRAHLLMIRYLKYNEESKKITTKFVNIIRSCIMAGS